MSIPESAWPDNGVAYMQQSKTVAQYMTIEASPPDEDGFSSICYGTFDANNRGLSPGTIVIRQSAELESLRAEVARLQGQSEDERKITGILLAHLGLDDSAAFTEAGVPNPGRLQSTLAYENKP